MALLDSTVGLIYSIKADDSSARKSVSDLRSHIDKETKQIEQDGSNAFLSLGKSVGLTDSQILSLGKTLPIAGAALSAVTGIIVGASAALFSLAKQASDYGSEIKDAQEKTGLAAETLSTLRYAGDQGGKSFESISAAVGKFSKLLGEAGNGTTDAVDKLKRLGLDPVKAANDLDGSLDQVLKRIYDLPPGVQQMNAATDAFGKTGADLIVTINAMGGDLGAFRKEAEKLGVVLTDSDTKAADDFGDTLVQLKAQAQGVIFTFAREFMPQITFAMQEVSRFFAENKATITAWGEAVKNEFYTAIDLAEKLAKLWRILKAPDLQGIRDAYNAESSADIRAREATQNANIVRNSEVGDYEPLRTKPAKNNYNVDADADKKAGKKAKSSVDSFDKQFRDFGKEIGFIVSSTARSKVFNKGTKHTPTNPQAGDLSIDGKSVDQIVFAMAQGIQKGWRTIDERFKGAIKGVNSTGPNTHFETTTSQKPSMFVENRPDLYGGQDTLDYLKKLDKERLGKKTSTDDVKKFAEDRRRELEKQQKDEEAKREARIKAIKDGNERINQLDDAQAKTSLSLLDSLLSQKLLKEDEYVRRIGEIKLRQLENEKAQNAELLSNPDLSSDEKRDLQLQDKILDEEITRQKLENADRTRQAIKQINDEYKEQIRVLNDLKREVADAQKDAFDFDKEEQRKVLQRNADRSYGKERINALVVLKSFEIEENDRRRDDALAQAELNRKNDAEKVVGLENEKALVDEINKLYEARKQTILGIHDAKQLDVTEKADADIGTEKKQNAGVAGIFAKSLGDLAGGGVDPTNQIKDQAEYIKAVYADLKDSAGGAIGSMVGGLAQMANAWIQTGKFSAKAALQMASSVVTGLAIQAGIKAIFEVAEGYASLAIFDARGAGLHFAAAATYGTIAGVAGGVGVGLGLASRAFGKESATGSNNPSTKSIGSNNSNNSNSSSERTITEGRRDSQELSRETTREIIFKLPRGMVENHVMEDFNSLGPIRDAVIKLQNA